MYIAKFGDVYLVKRMPNTGIEHSISCPSYTPPAELSGKAQFDDNTIKENLKDGTTSLRLGFGLSRKTRDQLLDIEVSTHLINNEVRTAKTEGTKLTLTSLLHYLWEQANFNRFTPNMKGKRYWRIIRKYLLEAAKGKIVKRQDLTELLYIPEFFDLENKEVIANRRYQIFRNCTKTSKTQLLLLIAEVKTIKPGKFSGQQLYFKHLPDCPFILNDDIFKRLNKMFKNEIELASALEQTHLIAIATFSVNSAGTPVIEEIALINVSENWIPFENKYEHILLTKLIENNRSLIKGLRYNLAKTSILASLVVTDSIEPTAIYIQYSEKQSSQVQEITMNSEFNSLILNIDDENYPNLTELT